MTAIAEAVRRMEAAGYRLAVDGGTLRVSPAERLNEEQRRWIRQHKPELLATLAALKDPNVKAMVELFDATVTAVYPNDGEHSGGGWTPIPATTTTCVNQAPGTPPQAATARAATR